MSAQPSASSLRSTSSSASALSSRSPSTSAAPTPTPATPCPPGTYALGFACLDCPPGAFCPGGFSRAPTLCGAGTWSAVTGAASNETCAPCSLAPGGYGCPPGWTDPAPPLCPVGTFCAGGEAGPAPCNPPAACPTAGLEAQPECLWIASTFATGFSSPRAPSVGPSGAVYVPNGASLFSLAPNGSAVAAVASSFTSAYAAAAAADAGAVFVADQLGNAVLRVALPSRTVTTVATGFDWPQGLAVAADDTIFVADTRNNVIKTVSPGGAVAVLAGLPATPGFVNAAGTSARFSWPIAVCVSASRAAYVCDQVNNALRIVSPEGAVSTLAGGAGAGSADGSGSAARFSSPTGVAVDAVGNAYVTDGNNNAVRLVTAAGVVTTLTSRTAGFTNGFGTAATFRSPFGLALTEAGSLVVSDNGNAALRLLACTPCPPFSSCASGVAVCVAGAYCPPALPAAPCPAGTYSPTLGATSRNTCRGCPRGAYCAEAATAPTLCPASTWSAAANATSAATCAACGEGTFSAVIGASSPAACSACNASGGLICNGGFDLGNVGFSSVLTYNGNIKTAGFYHVRCAARAHAHNPSVSHLRPSPPPALPYPSRWAPMSGQCALTTRAPRVTAATAAPSRIIRSAVTATFSLQTTTRARAPTASCGSTARRT